MVEQRGPKADPVLIKHVHRQGKLVHGKWHKAFLKAKLKTIGKLKVELEFTLQRIELDLLESNTLVVLLERQRQLESDKTSKSGKEECQQIEQKLTKFLQSRSGVGGDLEALKASLSLQDLKDLQLELEREKKRVKKQLASLENKDQSYFSATFVEQARMKLVQTQKPHSNEVVQSQATPVVSQWEKHDERWTPRTKDEKPEEKQTKTPKTGHPAEEKAEVTRGIKSRVESSLQKPRWRPSTKKEDKPETKEDKPVRKLKPTKAKKKDKPWWKKKVEKPQEKEEKPAEKEPSKLALVAKQVQNLRQPPEELPMESAQLPPASAEPTEEEKEEEESCQAAATQSDKEEIESLQDTEASRVLELMQKRSKHLEKAQQERKKQNRKVKVLKGIRSSKRTAANGSLKQRDQKPDDFPAEIEIRQPQEEEPRNREDRTVGMEFFDTICSPQVSGWVPHHCSSSGAQEAVQFVAGSVQFVAGCEQKQLRETNGCRIQEQMEELVERLPAGCSQNPLHETNGCTVERSSLKGSSVQQQMEELVERLRPW